MIAQIHTFSNEAYTVIQTCRLLFGVEVEDKMPGGEGQYHYRPRRLR